MEGNDNKATVALCKNVANMAEVKQILQSQPNVVLIKASLIIHIDQLLSAIYKSLKSQAYNTMKTRSMITEIPYNLSPSRNISEAIQTFTAADSDTEALVVALGNEAETLEHLLGKFVTFVPLSDICENESIQKVYKIPPTCSSSEDRLLFILNTIATKDYI